MGRNKATACILLFFTSALRLFSQNLNGLDKQLEQLQKEDKLADWIYARIEYCVEKPAERLNFLMLTENNSWRKPKNKEEREAWLNLLLNQGYYQLYTGNVLSSIEQYENAYSFYQRYPVQDFDLVEYVFKPLGNNYTRLGDYSRALYIHEKSLAISIAAKDSLAIAATYSNMAIAYKSVDRLKEAERSCLSGFRYLKGTLPLLGLLKSTLADIQYEKGNFDTAATSVESAIKILSKTSKAQEKSYWLLSAYTLAGKIAEERKQPGRALRLYTKGLDLLDREFRGSRIREKANLLNLLGSVYLKDKKPSAALLLFNRALNLLLPQINNADKITSQVLYGENRLYDALEGKGKSLLALERNEEALIFFKLALETGELSRKEYINNQDRIYYQRQAKKVAELAISSAYLQWTKTRKKQLALSILAIAEKSKARTLLDQIERNREYATRKSKDPLLEQKAALERAIAYYEKEEIVKSAKENSRRNKQEAAYKLSLLNRQIKRKYPLWEQQDLIRESLSRDIFKALPSSTTVVEFFYGENDVYVIRIRSGEITIDKVEKAQELKEVVESYVQTYFRNGPAAMINSPKDFFKTSHSLYQILAARALKQSGDRNLIIIPDDILGYLPFESLVSSGSYVPSIGKWEYLINKASVTYAYSLASLLTTKEERQNGKSFSGFFIASEGKGVPIPSVAAEARAVEKLVEGEFLLDEEATLANFRHSLNNSGVLHLGTHSFMYGEKAEPTLQLADGKFFLLELSAQKRVPALVILSACRTADGLLARGEGILSLSRGFIAAGTKGIIAGLWNVNDQSGSELISDFYSNLQKGNGASNALHQAKLSWLKKEHKNQALLLPYYWSSLIYVGQEQYVTLRKPSDYLFYLFGLLITAIISALIYWDLLQKRKMGKP